MRSTAQRLGDVTYVLVGVAVLTLLGRAWAAADLSHGHASTFWSYLGITVQSALVPAFAAACTSCWMDLERRAYARTALVVVLALAAMEVLGDVVFGQRGGANFLQDAASLLIVGGGFTLLAGLVTRHE